ncbi:cystathionine beta-synthase [Ekhidna sp.]|uniref:cystathionine beta-synthase n=1 Tax=Ekhidna sp. TaxID=2608089 RepID=UPI0035184E5C
MKESSVLNYIKDVLTNMPSDWLNLTTHRLDIYNEELAKTEFLQQFEKLYAENNSETSDLTKLPTAYDYIRLGHPLSTVLEWALAKEHNLKADQVIAFGSATIPILAVLRKNLTDGENTQIVYTDKLPEAFDSEIAKQIYGYHFELKKVASATEIPAFDGSTVFVSIQDDIDAIELNPAIDFHLSIFDGLGSILLINGEQNASYVSAIQHVRRRETIAMTPANCVVALRRLIGESDPAVSSGDSDSNKKVVLDTIREITGTDTRALLGSSGLSIQYAIMMGLVDHALEAHPGKDIRIIVPPNCYGGTNDQARRVAACLDNVEVLDLPVDGKHDMVQSTDKVLEQVANEDAIPFIIAEIPTNPRVEVPDLKALKAALSKKRKTSSGSDAIDPVFILDQTFCPNVQFLAENGYFSGVQAISYVSGSKFPSGGKCTAGYCVANKEASGLMEKIEKHLVLCDNEATDFQVAILAEQMPSMNERIAEAYKNTREFVNFIKDVLPAARINFVSEELAKEGFTPSVFSLDLPTKGDTEIEREAHKRELNNKLITMMITEIPNESKYCVSYGQLKGCYWTIPATSTQGTTKESDKDYIARVSVSPDLNLELHKKVFRDFVKQM